jgi:hypothetical protein
MSDLARTTPIAETITRDELARYLRWSGWNQVAEDQRGVAVFEHAEVRDVDGSAIDIVLPVGGISTWQTVAASVVEMLSAIERRSVYIVSAAIQSIDRDVLRQSVPDDAGFSRGIPLQEAPKYIEYLRSFISHAATTEQSPRAYHAQVNTAGKMYAEKCLFGHTFRGSFGFTVESPISIGALKEQPLVATESIDRPFERRVMERVAHGLQVLNMAAQNREIGGLVEGIARGLNVNMSEALLGIGEIVHGAPTSYSIIWSPEWPTLHDVQSLGEVRISDPGYRCLESFIREVAPPENPTRQIVTGLVTVMRSEKAPLIEEDVEHEIVVQSEEDGRNIHVLLPVAEYLEACKAHVEGRKVSVSGVLSKPGKYWDLDDPQEFNVLASDPHPD